MGVILGIESTAHTFSFGGVYTNGETIPSSSALFRPEKGGIHPREAADHHSLLSGELFNEFISKNQIPINQIDAIAFSQGPGLGPCLRVGASVARSLSEKIGKPLVGVNHCVAHIEIGRLQTGCEDPVLLYVSGGITKTVEATRNASQEKLESIGRSNLSQSSNYGTTTIEAKSGYGLSVESEIKILKATNSLSGDNQNILPTWLGAHDFPKDKKVDEYMDELINEQLPLIAEKGLAKWIDVFCEPGWFNLEQTETLVKSAYKFGLKSRLHVDEFVDSGGLSLAAELKSCSADHVGFSNDDSRDKANKSGTMQVFLPGTPYVLGKHLGLSLIHI